MPCLVLRSPPLKSTAAVWSVGLDGGVVMMMMVVVMMMMMMMVMAMAVLRRILRFMRL